MARTSGPIDLARLLAALADPTRLRLLNLMAGREVCVCYFVAILRMGQPKISRHLAYLRRAGLVSARRDGKWMHYRIRRPTDKARSSLLDTVLMALGNDAALQKDLRQLDQACCEPRKLVAIDGAPMPVLLQ